MRGLELLGLMAALPALAAAQGASAGPMCGSASPRVVVQVQPGRTLRAAVPQTLFGFDLPWYDAQIAYLRDGRLRPELLDWLNPFKGALYRYPAGSNRFDWRRAVGPVQQRRPVAENYVPGGQAVVQLGPEEFLQAMAALDGRPLWMLNLKGTGGETFDAPTLLRENLEYAQWIQQQSAHLCGNARSCQQPLYELGNELDWAGEDWSAARYVERSAPLLKALRQAQPRSRLIVMGQTAPWDPRSQSAARSGFDAEVAAALAKSSDGVSIHPYYDGHSVKVMGEFVDRLAATYRRQQPAQQVYVTEHGRWPAQPAFGRWEDNWYQASGSGGAVSAADFVLAMLPRHSVGGAVWHALGAQGPWQLIRWNRREDRLYPSPVYWSLRVLREAWLEDAVLVQPSQTQGPGYVGGYALRLAAMRGAGGQLSLLGVNRSQNAVWIEPQIAGKRWSADGSELRRLVADAQGSDNTDAQPDRFVMQTETGSTAFADGKALCVPANSVFSLKR